MDPVSLIAGGALVLAGFLAGRITRRKKPADAPRPRCGCGHSIGFHDGMTGRCHGGGDDCTCRHYDGPQPLETLYSREITDRGGRPPS